MLKRFAAFLAVAVLSLGLLAAGCSKPSPRPVSKDPKPTYDNTFYITSNYEVTKNREDDLKNLKELKKNLGGGGYGKVGFMGISRYMNETKGESEDYEFDPELLDYILKLSEDVQLPVVITLNGGPWGNVIHDPKTDVIEYLERDKENCQWKDDGTVPDDDQGPVPGLNRILTYNHYNTEVRKYQKRNIQAAARVIADFAKKNPELFLAVTTDPEVFMSPFYYSDYNPDTIKEFVEVEKEKFDSLDEFNEAMGTDFSSWEKVDPPRPSRNKGDAATGNPLWEEWTDFRVSLVDQYVQDEVDWVREMGIPASRVYTHQTVRFDNPSWMRYLLASPLKTAAVTKGSLGITTLQELCFDEELFTQAKRASLNWGNFEFNPATPDSQDYATYMKALRTIYKFRPHIVAPYMWLNPGSEPFYTVRGSEFEKAIRDFLKEIRNKPLTTSKG
jgi:hypothetical protein